MEKLVQMLLHNSNQFASGGLLLMVIGALGASLRKVPAAIWGWARRQVTLCVTVTDEDDAFEWMKDWFVDQPFTKRIRRLDIKSSGKKEKSELILGVGNHWFWYRGKLFWIKFYRSEEKKGGDKWSSARAEDFTLYTLGRDQRTILDLIEEVATHYFNKKRQSPSLHRWNGNDNYWERLKSYSARNIDSVVLKADHKQDLLSDVSSFLESKTRYAELGIPYHRGYLFHGLPGTGKSSLVSGLAQHFRLPIYSLDLSKVSDESLLAALNCVPERSVVVFEDIDCAKATGTRQIDSKSSGNTLEPLTQVSLSGLLNALDGICSPCGVVYVMTTNHIELLDPALIRPGRIDYRLHLAEASVEQKKALHKRFFPEATEEQADLFSRSAAATTMAEFQGELLKIKEGNNTKNVEG